MSAGGLLATPRGRALLFGCLYLSEGAPIGFVWWALPTLLRQDGVDVAQITTLTALLALPWAFKFLWAPLVDVVRGPGWDLRSWIVVAQVTMGLALAPLLVIDWAAAFDVVFVLLVLHAFAAATQDVAIDALSIETVPPTERGAINGWMQTGMLSGRALLGGVGLAMVPVLGVRGLVGLLLAVIWLSLLLLWWARPAPVKAVGGAGRWRELLRHLRDAAATRTTWIGLAIAAVGGAGFEAVGAVAGPYLVDRGASGAAIGTFFGMVSVPCMIFGALIGGRVADRTGKARATGVLLVAVLAAVVTLAVLDSVAGVGAGPRMFGLAAVYLALGGFTAASYALFMDLTDARVAATQFSAFMAMTNVCESWAAFAVGRAIPVFGYPLAFVGIALLSIMALPLLAGLAGRTNRES